MSRAVATSLSARHVTLVMLNTLRFALRSGTGVIFVLIVFYFGLTPCAGFLTFLEKGEEISAAQGHRVNEEQILEGILDFTTEHKGYINRFLGGGESRTGMSDAEIERYRAAEEWRVYLFRDQPLILTMIMVFLVYMLPLFTCTGTFNVFASELENYELRFELLRTSRASMYLGRYLGITTFSVLVILTVHAIAVFYLGGMTDFYEWEALLSWGLRGAVALIVLTYPYVAICQMISSGCSSPFPALLMSYGVMTLVPTFALVGFGIWEPMGYLVLLLPVGYHHYFFHPDLGMVALAVAGALLHALVYLCLGYLYFARRDL